MRARNFSHHPRMLLARPPRSDDADVERLYFLRLPFRRPLHSATLPRSFFTVERFRFDSSIRSFTPRGRGRLRRRCFSRRAISAARRSCSRRSNASSKRSRASLRFIACERESCTVTLSPLGRCRSVTAVETLLTFWPPGPPERANVYSRSASRNSIARRWPTTAECFRVRAA